MNNYNDRDTIQVNTSTNTKSSETISGDFSMLNLSADNYLALITPIADTTTWKMIIVSYRGKAVEGNFSADGILTDGKQQIQIRQVKVWEDGKVPTFKPIIGYEFFIDNKSIAAVQSSLDSFQKKFVWLRQDLDESMKTILAAASASLMVYTDDSMGKLAF